MTPEQEISKKVQLAAHITRQEIALETAISVLKKLTHTTFVDAYLSADPSVNLEMREMVGRLEYILSQTTMNALHNSVVGLKYNEF